MKSGDHRTRRQRRGINPSLEELNMTDEEIRARTRSGTGQLGVKEPAADPARIKARPGVLSPTEPREGPAGTSPRNNPA